ncbi:MAG: hypothetical protein JW862_19550 [Anaerolineales bacterium]|nr:hypothetical protein [Anaerolineales bacterium]
MTKIDSAETNPAKNTKSTLPSSISFGSIFMGYVAFTWASALVRARGDVIYRGVGSLIGIGLFLAIILGALAIDLLLAKLKLQKRIRSAIWIGAVLGPYAGIVASNSTPPTMSHIIGVVTTLVGFTLSWYIDGKLISRRT